MRLPNLRKAALLVLLYDRETESLWSQIRRQAISGPMRGERLAVLPLTHTSWRAWRKEHPNTEVFTAGP